MTASRRVFRGASAANASWIIAWMRGLAAMRAPRCAGAATSRALLYSIPDWTALCVACTMLSSVKPWNSLSRDRCPTSSSISAARCSCKIVWPCTHKIVIDATHAKTVTLDSKFCGHSECDASSCYCRDLGHVLHVTSLHSGGAAAKPSVQWMTSVFCGFRSAPTFHSRRHGTKIG